MSTIVPVPDQHKSDAFVQRLTQAAHSAQLLMPAEAELVNEDDATKRLFKQLGALYQDILSPVAWNDEKLTRIAHEADWARTGVQLAVTLKAIQATIDLERRGSTSATQCSDDYDNCIKENSCAYSIFCICCLPCSLQYLGCMRKILGAKEAPISTLIALGGKWASGGVPGPVITVNGNALTVDMSAYHRPIANGFITDTSDIVVNFPDDRAYTGILHQPNTINWSNKSAWTKA